MMSLSFDDHLFQTWVDVSFYDQSMALDEWEYNLG